MIEQPVQELTGPELPRTPAGCTLISRFMAAGPVRRVVGFYKAHERYAPALFFFGGVGWDAATLRRIDALFDNIFLLAYLIALGGLIVVAALVQQGRVKHPWLVKYREAYPSAIQFFLGALFSAYVVYYSQSASLTGTSLFLLLLVGLLIANEFIHRRLLNLYLLFGLYFLAAFSFFIFFVPILTKTMGYWTFLGGGALSVLVVIAMLHFLDRKGGFVRRHEFFAACGIVLGLFGVLNLFYVQNWIPPVPLALRHGGIYHHVKPRTEAGVYDLSFEKPHWYEFWVKSNRTFRYSEGDTVYCFTAIFAPTDLKTRVYHVWSYYDPGLKEWVQTDRIGYHITGSRDRGYRGHTRKRNLQPGRWRVDVQTAEGKTLSRIPFRVVRANRPVTALKTISYE